MSMAQLRYNGLDRRSLSVDDDKVVSHPETSRTLPAVTLTRLTKKQHLSKTAGFLLYGADSSQATRAQVPRNQGLGPHHQRVPCIGMHFDHHTIDARRNRSLRQRHDQVTTTGGMRWVNNDWLPSVVLTNSCCQVQRIRAGPDSPRTPRSQKMTLGSRGEKILAGCHPPPSVAEGPRLVAPRPISLTRLRNTQFCMLRAPICNQVADRPTASTSNSDITSVTTDN